MTPLLAQRPRTDRAFERMYKKHVRDVYRYSLVVLRNAADAEDVTQTTFMNAYRAFQRGERPDHAERWLIAIAHNVCRQRFRNASRRPQEVEYEENDVTDVVPDDDAPTAEDIRRALKHLNFNQRSALVMREIEGRSYAEIAEVLALTVPAVETLIFRARRALREQLEGTLTCQEAELALSKGLDGALVRADKGKLRAHLRECGECATHARRMRAQRSALKALAAVPLPASLSSFFGGGTAAAATGLAAKAAAVAAAGAVVVGGGYEAQKRVPWRAPADTPAAAQTGNPPRRAASISGRETVLGPALPTTTPGVARAVPGVQIDPQGEEREAPLTKRGAQEERRAGEASDRIEATENALERREAAKEERDQRKTAREAAKQAKAEAKAATKVKPKAKPKTKPAAPEKAKPANPAAPPRARAKPAAKPKPPVATPADRPEKPSRGGEPEDATVERTRKPTPAPPPVEQVPRTAEETGTELTETVAEVISKTRR